MANKARANRDASERLSKQDWIVAALREIGERGVAGLRLDNMTRSLAVTKGSFYWHFKDRDALLVEMVRYWQHSLTSAVGDFIRTEFDAPRDRMNYLLRLASDDRHDVPGGAVEHALREWARSSELARRTVLEVDNERLAILTDIYMEMGMRKSRAASAALLALSHLIGVNVIHRDVGLQAFKAQREMCLDFLLRLPEHMD